MHLVNSSNLFGQRRAANHIQENMFAAILSLLILTLTFILSATLLLRKHDGIRLPPGPAAFPVFGNLPMLGKLPHRKLHAMAQRYGPIMSLRLGHVSTVVISNAEAAERFLRSHDAVFATRPILQASKYFGYGKGMVFCEYGAYWRNMRRLCTTQLLSTSKVSSFAILREREVEEAVKLVHEAAMIGEVVDLSDVVQNVVEDIAYKIVLGRNRDDEFDLKGLILEGMRLSGAFNLADYVPWLGALDLQGLTRSFKRISKELDQVLEKIIKEHKQGSGANNDLHKNFIDILLSLMHQPIDPSDEQSQVIDRTCIKAIVLDMIGGAFDTTSTTIAWSLSELIRHPRVMKNLQDELANVVGMNRFVEENDLEKLSYLDIVIKETLRLHPAGAILPRASREDVIINGYYVGKKSTILVNMWALGRDPKAWSNYNVEEFYPERFITNNLDFRGYNLQFMPFGTGRRGCPGIHLGVTIVKLLVAQLAHCFTWELPGNMTPNDLDMSEKFGLSLPRAKHLLAVPTYRLLCEVHK